LDPNFFLQQAFAQKRNQYNTVVKSQKSNIVSFWLMPHESLYIYTGKNVKRLFHLGFQLLTQPHTILPGPPLLHILSRELHCLLFEEEREEGNN